MALKLLIGFEGTQWDRQALAYVAPLASDPTVEFTLLIVGRNPATVESLSEEARRIVGPAPVRQITASGSIYSALLDTARAAPYDLVIFGEVEGTWSRWTRLRQQRSLSAALPCSSLLVRGDALQIRHALICSGGDETVIADSRLTGRLARRTGARATIMHVLSQVPLVFGRGVGREHITEAFAATGAPEMKHMQAAVAELTTHGVEAEIKIRVGLVVEEIVDELAAGGYDLLVVGAHRSNGLVERLLLENVTADIVPQSPVPVLVVKDTDGGPPAPPRP
jgi:nucleotide-binding universal stress UspA family protein